MELITGQVFGWYVSIKRRFFYAYRHKYLNYITDHKRPVFLYLENLTVLTQESDEVKSFLQSVIRAMGCVLYPILLSLPVSILITFVISYEGKPANFWNMPDVTPLVNPETGNYKCVFVEIEGTDFLHSRHSGPYTAVKTGDIVYTVEGLHSLKSGFYIVNSDRPVLVAYADKCPAEEDLQKNSRSLVESLLVTFGIYAAVLLLAALLGWAAGSGSE